MPGGKIENHFINAASRLIGKRCFSNSMGLYVDTRGSNYIFVLQIAQIDGHNGHIITSLHSKLYPLRE